MKRYVLLALILLSQQLIWSSNIRFHTGTFEAAKDKAQNEGKMLLIDFYASWCAPCKWMEQTTFKDPKVVETVNEKFIPLKINIDDFDGYALKKHFGVNVLPTILIFNEEGKIIERIEETLSPVKMLNLLDKSVAAYTPKLHAKNKSPKDVVKNALKDSKRAPFKLASQKSNYKLQLGLFGSYESTLSFYNEISAVVEEPIVILHDYKGSSVVYRVLLGNFSSTHEAHFYKSSLKEKYNIDSHLYL